MAFVLYPEYKMTPNLGKSARGATALKSQDLLKWLLSDGSTGDLVVSKALIHQP